jgi:DNA-binding transcriptional LysR family regulator
MPDDPMATGTHVTGSACGIMRMQKPDAGKQARTRRAGDTMEKTMQLSWLEDFVELARTRSFSRAAENRFVTHPAFGRRIRALENWVGTELVERSQPLNLTPAGVQFLDAATHALDVLLSSRAQLQDAEVQPEQSLKIATGRTLATTFFPDWYQAINRRSGPLAVEVCTGGAQEAIMRLSAGDVDLMMIYSTPTTRMLLDPKRYESVLLDRELLLPVSATDDKGRARFRPDMQQTQKNQAIPWLAFARSLTLRGLLANHLAGLSEKPMLRRVYQADSYESILEMARRGMGLAWLPQRLVLKELQAGELVIVGDISLRVGFDIAMVRLRGNPHPLVETIWQGLLADAARGK